MTGSGYGVGRSPLEVVGIAVILTGIVGLGVLWGVGVVVASLMGSTLPGTAGEGVAALVRAFPDVGRAWEPSIPTGLVWGLAVVLVGAFAPLVWRVVRAGQLADEGAQWATKLDLKQAGLLVPDRPLPHAELDEEEESDA